jgi:phage gp29-like protein
MADNQKALETQAQGEVPPLPQKGAVVSQDALYMSQISLYRNTLAFGGVRNPTDIWATMKYNHPQAMMCYRELEEKDEDVASALHSLRLSVLERDRSVKPFDDSQQALDVAKFIQAQIAALPDFHAVLDCILDAPGYGFSVQEMIFDTSMGQASLTGVNDCPQELFLFGDRYKPQIGQLQFLNQPWASSGEPQAEEKFIVFSYRSRARNRMGAPLLKDVFWPSWLKRNMLRLWVQFGEKGPGTGVVRYNDADNAQERQRAAELAQAIVENMAVAVPANMQIEIELLKSARSQDPAVYEKFYQAMQYSIARRIMGETLTSFGNEGGGGSKAQGETHSETLDKRSVELCRAVMSVMNRQLVRPLVLWNFGPTAPMPTWAFDLEEAEDLELRLTIDSGLQRMGKKFTVGYIADRYDAPVAGDEDPEALIVPNVNAPQVQITDRAVGSFAEGGAAASHIEDELKQFDRVLAGLQKEAAGLLAERVREVADAAAPAAVK